VSEDEFPLVCYKYFPIDDTLEPESAEDRCYNCIYYNPENEICEYDLFGKEDEDEGSK